MSDSTSIVSLSVGEIIPGPNDRTVFEPEALRELAASIAEHGLLQPIAVRFLEEAGVYEVIAGERRFRACRDLLKWEQVPCLILDVNVEEASALMLSENVARQDLNPIDEARAYAKRMDLFGWDVKTLSEKAGVSSVRVLFRLKLLRLEPSFLPLVQNGHFPMGYAQVLADGGLTFSGQRRAFSALQDQISPTPAWFRKVVCQIAELEQQQEMLTEDFMQAETFSLSIVEETTSEPPTPSTGTPPVQGESLSEILSRQIAYWQQAAQAWEERGKPFKRQECEAAAHALKHLCSLAA